MLNSRVLILAGFAVLVAVVLVWKWIAGWGYVTLDVRNEPLARVIKSIERQGGVKIQTNADPSTPVTMLVEKVPAYEAIDTLAVAVDGEIRLAYVAADDDRKIKDVLAAFSSGANPGGWTVYAGGFGGRGGGQGPERNDQGGQPRDQQAGQNAQPREQRGTQQGDQAGERRGGPPQGGGDGWGGGGWGGGGLTPGGVLVDPRSIVWKPSDLPEKNLQTLFDQGSQKTGAIFALPEGWNPALSKLPKEGRTGDVTVTLVKNAKGSVREIFLLTVRPPRPQTAAAGEEGGRWEFSRTVFSPQRGGQRNAEWMAERVQAQIAALPKNQQAEARKQMDEMRAFWESVRNLPEEERRAKIEEAMNRPEVQDRMEESRNAHDSKTPPQRREDRMRRYIERKAQVKGTPAKS